MAAKGRWTNRLCGLNEIPFLPDVISNKAEELYG